MTDAKDLGNHERLTLWVVVPLLVIDVWEHAYYLKYRNKMSHPKFYDRLRTTSERLNIRNI